MTLLEPAPVSSGCHALAGSPPTLKVFCVINGLGPGGAERSLAELLPHYLEAGIDVRFVCLRHRDIGSEEAVRALGCQIEFIGVKLGRAIWRLRRLIRRVQPDVVHTTLFEADLVGRVAAAGTGVPVLTSLVNTTYEPVRLLDPNVRSRRLRVVQAIDGWTSRHLTAHFHAIGDAVADSGVKSLGIKREKVTVVRRGRSGEGMGSLHPQRRLQARQALQLTESDFVVVNVARQEYQKGQEHLLRAVAKLPAKYSNLRVVVAGRPGHATPLLERLQRELSLKDRCRFLGHRADVPEILAAADLFVFPSLYEGLGGALIEAMALGLPIVASDIPALREVVEDGVNADLVPPGDPDALGKAIVNLIADPQRRQRYALRSRERFESTFTIEAVAEQMIALYKTLLQK